jgi:stage IV sporulation protein FB
MLQSLSLIVLCTGFLAWVLTSPGGVPLCIFSAIIIHEAGHLCAAYLLRMKPSGATADTIGIRLLFRGSPPSYGKEIFLCAAGPLANLLSIPICLAAGDDKNSVFLSTSAALALLNLLPIEGFDGGRMVHSTLLLCLPPHKADAVCELLSFFFLFVLWCISVYLMMRVGNQLSLFFFSTAIFFRIFLQKKPP